MQTYYCRYNVSPGNGSGLLGDPWNPNDVLPGNPKGLVANSVVLLIKDGSNAYTVTAPWQPTWAGAVVGICDPSGYAIGGVVRCDAGGLLSGNVLQSGSSGYCFWGIEAFQGPSVGISHITHDYGIAFNCIATECLWGHTIGSGVIGLGLYYCGAIDYVNYGFGNSESNLPPEFIGCYAIGGGFYGFDMERARMSKCLVIIDHTAVDNGGFTAISSFNNQNKSVMIDGCTIYQTGVANIDGNIYGIRVQEHNQSFITDCLVQGLRNTGLGNAVAYSATVNIPWLAGGLVAYDCDNDTDAAFDTIPVLDLGGPANIDPNFVNPSIYDLTPQIDMVDTALIQKIMGEQAWRDPGALSHLLAGGGGSGGAVQIGSPFIRSS
jgi:hypothetical protein